MRAELDVESDFADTRRDYSRHYPALVIATASENGPSVFVLTVYYF